MTQLSEQYRNAHRQERSQPEPQLWQRLEKKLEQSRPARRLPFTRIAVAASISVLILVTAATLFLLQHNTASSLSASNVPETIAADDLRHAAAAQHDPLPALPSGQYEAQIPNGLLSLESRGREISLSLGGQETLYEVNSRDSSAAGTLFQLSADQKQLQILLAKEGELRILYQGQWYPLAEKGAD